MARVAGRAGEPVDGGGDEPQCGRVLLDRDVRVGHERELQHLGEDVRQAAQLLPAEHARGGREALHGDGALLRGQADPHGVAEPLASLPSPTAVATPPAAGQRGRGAADGVGPCSAGDPWTPPAAAA